jgi:hypothetical protein
MNIMHKNCQSCGMPIKGKPELLGSNADDTKNQTYCMHCYLKGEFTQPDLSSEQMQSLCISKMKEMGIPRPLGWLFTRNIPKLARWSS